MSVALIIDVDGVVSPVRPLTPTWGDEVVAGNVLGPVLVSPMLCARLDALASLPDVLPGWLTSWDPEMRAAMDPWPGRNWPDIGNLTEAPSGPGWWKRTALETWLDTHPQVTAVAWCDDDLRSAPRRAAIRRRLAARGLNALLIAPSTTEGLTPTHLRTLTAWIKAATDEAPEGKS